MSSSNSYKFVHYRWDDLEASKLDPVGRLVYRSNLLGSDLRITNTGGGNTSSKIIETHPLTGQPVEVLWVKGSGGDLRTARKEHFASLYQEKLLSLQPFYLKSEKRGPKTEIEDSMVGLYAHCTYNLNPCAPSIDTPLHSFIHYKHVDHAHPNVVIAVAAAKNAKGLTKRIFGDDVIWIPWQRPGFDLGLKLQEVCRQHPEAKGVVLGQHGLISWADDDKECYDRTLRLIETAAGFFAQHDRGGKTFGGLEYGALDAEQRRSTFVRILPWLRGHVSRPERRRVVGTIQDDNATLQFVNSVDAGRLARLGASCPDYFLRTKVRPLYVGWDPMRETLAELKTKLDVSLIKYRQDYAEYYNRCKHRDSPSMRDPNPTVVLIPGLGMITWGKTKSESRVTAEFYKSTVEVMKGAEAIDEYVSIPEQEAFDIEYWLLEEAKLRRMPAEKELDGQIVCVVGAGSGIGREVAHRLVKEGAHVACADLDGAAAASTANEIIDSCGAGIGVGGTGISCCGPAISLRADITRRESIGAMLEEVVLAYGGLDGVAVTAGIFVPPDTSGHVPDHGWTLTYAINVTGAYFVADEAGRLWREQGLPASFVLTTSVNGVVVKKGSVAYDTSKAAANHLVRELAVELAPLVRVNGISPATVIGGSAMFPRDRVIASLAMYGIPSSEDESDEALRTKLARFYADRTLTKQPVTAADQAEAVFLLMSSRLGKTTGQILTVDGGLQEAFLR